MSRTSEELFAAIDLGGTMLKAALGTAQGEIVAERSVATKAYDGPEAVIERMAQLITTLSETEATPRAIGVGCPGLVDRVEGRTLFLPNLASQWRGVPLGERLAERVGCPVYVLNDARMATLGELVFGEGRERLRPTLVLLTLGTGIGGGVAIEGRLRLGALGAAGELGHLVIEQGGRPCGCGSRGCVEAYASAPAMIGEGVRLLLSGQAPKLHDLVRGDASGVSPKSMAQAADQGDESIVLAIDRAARALGLAIANMTVAIHPEVAVLTGGVAQMGDRLLSAVRRAHADAVQVFPPTDVEIVISRLGDKAGVVGGLALASLDGNLER